MGRRPCCAKEGLNRGAWSAREDKILTNYIKNHGEGKWRDLPLRAGLKRCGKSCRLRWLNYLRPDIKRGNISLEEEELIIRLHKLLGNRWSLIAGRLPGRTDNEIKNYWNTNLSKRVEGDKNDDFKKQCSKLERKGSMESNPGTKPETQPPVIRTKAVRCTKVIIPWQLDNQMVKNKNIFPVWDCDSPSCSAQQDDNSCGFLKDFDIDDLLISGVLYSDDHLDKEIINECEIGVDGDEVQPKNMSISCPDHHHQDFPVSRDDDHDQAKHEDSMDEAAAARPDNWRDSHCGHGDPFQPNDHALDLTTLASFLNSEDEWIS